MSTIANLEIRLADSAATEQLGFNLGSLIASSACIALLGPLGAGKTTFAKGFGRSLDIAEVINSPTFTVLNEYRSGRLPLYHLDLYRLAEDWADSETAKRHGSETLADELDELMATAGVLLIEWASYFESYIQRYDHLSVQLTYLSGIDDNASGQELVGEIGRGAVISAHGPESSSVLSKLANVYFS